MGRQLNPFRLIALTVALGAAVLILVSSQLPWMHATSPVGIDHGITFQIDKSGGLDPSSIQVLGIAAIMIAVLAAISFIPYLRFLSVAVMAIGLAGIVLALGVMSDLNKPVVNNLLGPVLNPVIQRSPGAGVYVLIAGATLAFISGVLTLLSPRTRRSPYQPGVQLYTMPEGGAVVTQWMPEGPEQAQILAPTPGLEKFPKPSAPPTKNAVLYAMLGLIIPGLPSLLIRGNKTVGAVQLGIWVLSLALALVLMKGFLIWPVVAIWSAITGYSDAQRYNRQHGYHLTST